MITIYNAQRYCKDDISKIENYDKAIADTTQMWHCHHRLELTLDCEFAHSAAELRRFGMYYKRPYFELIFLTNYEHKKLHSAGMNNPIYGKKLSAETKQKISDSVKGKNKGKTLSAEARLKLSASLKGRKLSDEHKRKLSEAYKRHILKKSGMKTT